VNQSTVVKNLYKPVTNKFDGAFYNFGPKMTQLLTKYPIENPLWHVFGEEFITSYTLLKGDQTLLDPWRRLFPEEMCDSMKTIDRPEKHVKVPTTVEGVLYMCNIYMNELNTVIVECNLCIGKRECLECKKTGKKMIVFPKNN
jgi:hypothetical protein